MRRRALLRAVGVGAGTLALPTLGRSGAALGGSSTDATAFQEVARWSPLDAGSGWDQVHYLSRILHDVYVQGDYAYCAYWDAGGWILDVSDPTSPTFVSRVGDFSQQELTELADDPSALRSAYGESPGNAHYVAVDDEATLMGVGAEGWDDEGTDARGPGGIDLYDVSDPENPERLSTIEPPEATDETRADTWVTSHNFEIRGDRLYSSWYQAGVKLHDISDPENPEQLAWWREPDEATFWTAQVVEPGEFFVASSTSIRGGTAGLYTFPDRAGEQADPPSLTDEVTGTTTATSTATATTTASDGTSESDTDAYGPLGFVEIAGASEAVVGDDEETVYVATGDGFATVDVSDPTDPTVLAERRNLLAERDDGPLTSILDVKVDGDKLVVPGPAQSGALRGFLLYDVSDPADPQQVGPFFETRTGNHNGFIQDDYVYLTANDGRRNPLVVVDVSNPSTTTTTTEATTTGATTTEATTTEATTTEATTTWTTTTTTVPDTPGTESQPTPGFGVGAAVGGLGIGALWLRRLLRDDDEE